MTNETPDPREHEQPPDAPSSDESPTLEATTPALDSEEVPTTPIDDEEDAGAGGTPFAAEATFDDMGLSEEVKQALDEMGYFAPMKVQVAVYEHVRAERDLMVQSRTGSGKTAAFGIPLVEAISGESKGVQAMVLAPTRELALQVAQEVTRIGKHKSVQPAAIYGGAPMNPQIRALKDGAQIVAGTPGRVLDHIRRKTLNTDGIRMLVLDEADEMLSMGFAEEIDKIISTLPPKESRQTLLFSATIPPEIERIGKRHMREPEKISLSSDGVSVDQIDHFYYVVTGMARTRDLLKLVVCERPESAIIFCNTREDTNTVAKFLCKNGYDAEAISSDLSQRDRERVMKRMRDRNLRFLVATDIAARGIDISDLSHVINYTFPESPEVYVHRTGRTGRAGKRGVALSLVGPREIGAFYYLKLTYKIRPQERDLPSTEELKEMQEGERYEKVVSMVTESASEAYLSLARRLWDSQEGERVVGVLLERLLTVPPPMSEKKEAAAAEARAEDGDRPRRARRTRGRDRDRGRGDRDRGRGDRDRGRGDRDRERPDRERKRRRRGEKRESGTDTLTEDTSPMDEALAALEDQPTEEIEADRNEKERSPEQLEAVQDAAETSEDGEPKRKRRRRRSRRDSGDREEKRSARATEADGGPKEFWEAWADEKKAERSDNGGSPKPAKKRRTRNRRESRDRDRDREPRESQVPDGTTRLYVNIGKREEADADQIRALLSEGTGEEAEKLGSVAIRNTHCYVRVPDEMADKIIEAASGKSFKERDVVVERARR